MLSNIQNIERRFNTAFCYVIAEEMAKMNFPNGDILNMNIKTFSKIFATSSNIKLEAIQKEIKDFLNEIKSVEMIKKYSQNLNNTPIWTFSLLITFGKLIRWFNKLESSIKLKIMNLAFPNKFKDDHEFRVIMESLNNIRNRCCHNNVVYKIKITKNNKNINNFLLSNKISNKNSKSIKLIDFVKIIDSILFKNKKEATTFSKFNDYFNKILLSKNIPDVSKQEIKRIINY